MAKILIVDDSPSQLMGIQRIVEKLGHESITAEDGAAGDVVQPATPRPSRPRPPPRKARRVGCMAASSGR